MPKEKIWITSFKKAINTPRIHRVSDWEQEGPSFELPPGKEGETGKLISESRRELELIVQNLSPYDAHEFNQLITAKLRYKIGILLYLIVEGVVYTHEIGRQFGAVEDGIDSEQLEIACVEVKDFIESLTEE
jgi:hypothetical protein